MALHVGLSAHLGSALAKNGFTFVGFDQRGHGKSEGEKGYLDSEKDIMNNCRNFISEVMKIYPGVPIFLLGQGMGGLITLTLVKENKFKIAGVILFSSTLKKPGNKLASSLSGFALKILPNRKGLFKVNFANHTKNLKGTAFMEKDPLIYQNEVFAGTLTQLSEILDKNDEDDWKKMKTPPIAIVQGQLDKIVDPINAINFFERIKTEDKELWWYP